MEHIIELSCGQAEFPDVIVWDSRNSDYRTPSRNTFFDIIDRFTAGCIKKRRKNLSIFPPWSLVRMARLELAQDNSHYPLKVARLPFRHIRFYSLFLFGIANVRLNFESANFF